MLIDYNRGRLLFNKKKYVLSNYLKYGLMTFNTIRLIIKHGFTIQNLDSPHARHPRTDARQTKDQQRKKQS